MASRSREAAASELSCLHRLQQRGERSADRRWSGSPLPLAVLAEQPARNDVAGLRPMTLAGTPDGAPPRLLSVRATLSGIAPDQRAPRRPVVMPARWGPGPPERGVTNPARRHRSGLRFRIVSRKRPSLSPDAGRLSPPQGSGDKFRSSHPRESGPTIAVQRFWSAR